MAGTSDADRRDPKRRKLVEAAPEDSPQQTTLSMEALAAHDRMLSQLLEEDSDDDLVSISSMSTLDDEIPPPPPATLDPSSPTVMHVPSSPTSSFLPSPPEAVEVTPKPVLRGPYEVWYNEVKWSGSWGFSPTAFDQPGQTLSKFSYKCIKCTDPDVAMNRPKSGVYEGYFLLQPFQGKPKRIVEKAVTIAFTPTSPTTYVVAGSGKNKYGAFELRGTFEWGAPLQVEKIYVS
ncbi:hypothetical protein ACHHYP_03465 [Achlya hypogyna]|uniref:Uncharacterized protein n=1 Tax=Achlya hypogyna TaxID=1202772 RepID=A0A1V9Z3M2_ACHHY|nr:hypothetical protein ACHHYP_03465 [Achlya hypogyna]